MMIDVIRKFMSCQTQRQQLVCGQEGNLHWLGIRMGRDYRIYPIPLGMDAVNNPTRRSQSMSAELTRGMHWRALLADVLCVHKADIFGI